MGYVKKCRFSYHSVSFLLYIMFLDIIHRPVFIYLKTKRFGDWILSPSSGKTYSVGPNR
jgi:hypothetical protein